MSEIATDELDQKLKEEFEANIDLDSDYLRYAADVLARGDLQLEEAATKDAKVQELWKELLKDPAFFLKNEILYLNSIYQNRSVEKTLPDGRTRIDFATREPSKSRLAELYSITLEPSNIVDGEEQGKAPQVLESSRETAIYSPDAPTLVTIRIEGDDVRVFVDAYERGVKFVLEETDPDTKNALLKEMILESMTAAGKVARRDDERRRESDADTLQMLQQLPYEDTPRLHHLRPTA